MFVDGLGLWGFGESRRRGSTLVSAQMIWQSPSSSLFHIQDFVWNISVFCIVLKHSHSIFMCVGNFVSLKYFGNLAMISA